MKRLRFFLVWGTVLGLLIPGVGMVIALVMTVCAGPGGRRVQPDEGRLQTTLPVVVQVSPRMQRIAGELDFVPLVEILSGTDIDLKRGAIEQLVRLKTPEAIHVLLDHRSDASLEMRYYVNAALSRIKNEFDGELDAARQQIQHDTYKSSARVFLAKIYLHYARSGLLDAELVQSYENEAIFHLTFVIESGTPTSEAFRTLIGCLLDREQWEQAEVVLKRARETGKLTPTEIDQYRVMIFYHMRCYAEIPALIRSMCAAGEIPKDWQTAALWWGGSL